MCTSVIAASTKQQSIQLHTYHSMADYKLSFNDSLTSDKTYEELQLLENDRRQILRRVEHPFLRILLTWHGTCLKSLISDWLVWLTMIVFVGIRIQARSGQAEPAMAEQMSDTDVHVLGGFLSFFLVLFVNQTNARFFEMYKLSKKCAGQIQDVAGIVTGLLPRAEAHRLVRYMNAGTCPRPILRRPAPLLGLYGSIIVLLTPLIPFVLLNSACCWVCGIE